jgi:hypothetical protein
MTIQNMDSAQAGGNLLCLQAIQGEPRIKDLDLAARLGFGDPHMIRRLIARHAPALAGLGVSVTMTESTGGRPGTAYYLNCKQAIFVTTKSETPNATDITIEIIERFDAYENGTLAAPKSGDLIISTMQQLIAIRQQQIDQGQRIGALEQQVSALPTVVTHMTVLGYAKLHDVEITMPQARRLGKCCTAETTLAGEMIGSAQDDRYGVIQTYPLAILKTVFEEEDLN